MIGKEALLKHIREIDGREVDWIEINPGQLDRSLGIVYKDNNEFGYKLRWFQTNQEKWKFRDWLQGRGYVVIAFCVDQDRINTRFVNDLLSRN